MAQHGSLGCAKDPSSSTGGTEGAPDRDPEGPPPELWSHPSMSDAASYPNSGTFPQLKLGATRTAGHLTASWPRAGVCPDPPSCGCTRGLER